MAKKSQKQVSRNPRKSGKPRSPQNSGRVLAIDLGGTKILLAAVDRLGKMKDVTRERVDLADGYPGLLRQIVRLAKPLIEKHEISHGAIAAAGPLDPVSGQLLNPTNLKIDHEFWGVVPIARDISRALKIPVQLENDAAAAALAESWVGQSKKYQNSVMVTLGTGLGLGVIANGELLRAGQHLHTEGGHVTMNYLEKDWQCGCGNYGCAEAYLSGTNFTKNVGRIWGRPNLRGEDIVVEARSGESHAVQAFQLYGEKLATFIYSTVMLFAPEVVVMSGGFSNAHDLFLPITEKRLSDLLKMHRAGVDMLPKLKISKFCDEAGLLGAAYVAMFRQTANLSIHH